MHRVALAIALLLFADAATAQRRRAVKMPPADAPHELAFAFDFRNGSPLGWEAGFADYGVTMDVRELAEYRGALGWYLSGWNYSDDLFMFVRGRVSVRPSQNYVATFRVTFATNAGPECGGIGGAPGESVYVKLGISGERPEAVVVQDHYRMNVDKGNQVQSGVHASQAGNISADRPLPCSDAPYDSVVREHSHPYAVRSSAAGDLWLLFGVDSGFEGFNSIYVERIEVTLTPAANDDPRASWQSAHALMESILERLQQAGISAIEIGRLPFPPLGARDIVFKTGDPARPEELHFYIFDSALDRVKAKALIGPDGSSIGQTPIEWIAPPHFFDAAPLVIVNYVGSSDEVLSVLRQHLVDEFAGQITTR